MLRAFADPEQFGDTPQIERSGRGGANELRIREHRRMAHPIMFEEDDPVLGRVRALALALPGVEERIQHGRPWFAVVGRPGFAVYGSGAKGPTKVMHPHAVVVHVDDDERPARLQDPRFFVPAYLGPRGWLGIDVDGRDTDWTEVAELLDASWRRNAPVRVL